MAHLVKNPPVKAGDARDAGFIPWLGRCLGEGSGNPLQYSCLGVSWTEEAGYSPWGHKESNKTEHTHTHTHTHTQGQAEHLQASRRKIKMKNILIEYIKT